VAIYDFERLSSMEYAVISFRNNQHLVKPGDKITSLGEVGKVGDIITDINTLLVKDGEVKIGEPTIDYPITLKVVEVTKTDKVDIFKYKGKSRYRRHTGHRQAQTVLEVVIPIVEKEVKAVKASKKAATTK
jgi:large subunit ribosomal protein L21